VKVVLSMTKLIKGGSLEILKGFKDNSIDHTITSPPYNMNLRVSGDKYISRQIVKEISTKYDGYDDNLSMDQYYEFTRNILNELLRVTKQYVFYNVQFLTGNKKALFKIIGEFNDQIKEIIIWDKKHGQPAVGVGVMNSQYEIIIILTKDHHNSMRRNFVDANFDKGTLANLWSINKKRSPMKNHNATFPIELIEKIIINFTNKNEIILDPFMGTGTTGVVAINNSRDFIGIELLSKYYDFAENRINDIKRKCPIEDLLNNLTSK